MGHRFLSPILRQRKESRGGRKERGKKRERDRKKS